jgi:ketosteroid isomerase-like protein
MSDVELADRIALQDVMLRYAAGVDERDFELYASAFAEDVEILDFGPEPVQGRSAWVDYVKEALQSYTSTQHLLSPLFAHVDGDMANCRTDVQALHCLKEPEGEIFILWATYESQMRRTTGGWKIQRHRLVPRATRRS